MTILHMPGIRPRDAGIIINPAAPLTFGDSGDRVIYTATGLLPVAADERAVIAIGGRQSSTRTILSVTIGGKYCKELHHVDNSGTTAAIWLGPVGATGDVVVTLVADWARCMVSLWPCKNIKSTVPFDTGGSVASSLADTINCEAGGAIFGVVYNNNTGAATWAGLVGNEFNHTTSEAARLTGRAAVGAAGALAVSCDFPTEANQAMCLVALSPGSPILQEFYETDFSEYTTLSAPPDWTLRYATTDITPTINAVPASMSGKALRITKTGPGRVGFTWNKIPDAADCEILLRARTIEAAASNENFISAMARGGGSLGAETLYRHNVYNNTADTRWLGSMARYVAGTSGLLGSPTSGPSPNFAINTWFYLRFRVEGFILRRKQWYSGTAEPGWQEEIIDGNITAAGWTGVFTLVSTANPNVEIDYFAASITPPGGEQPIPIPVPV